MSTILDLLPSQPTDITTAELIVSFLLNFILVMSCLKLNSARGTVVKPIQSLPVCSDKRTGELGGRTYKYDCGKCPECHRCMDMIGLVRRSSSNK